MTGNWDKVLRNFGFCEGDTESVLTALTNLLAGGIAATSRSNGEAQARVQAVFADLRARVDELRREPCKVVPLAPRRKGAS